MLLETNKTRGLHPTSPLPSPAPPVPSALELQASATLREPYSQEMFWFLWDRPSCADFVQFLSSLPVTRLAEIAPHLWAWGPPCQPTTPEHPRPTVGRMHAPGCLPPWGQDWPRWCGPSEMVAQTTPTSQR